VRTRADSDTKQARKNDTNQRERAVESGAQFISTDYPTPDSRWSDYCVQWPDRAVYRRNPVTTR
ncbi:MAG: Ca2+-dependent phosphoinositide-specific phospholipase C, partial [Pirellula sp.]